MQDRTKLKNMSIGHDLILDILKNVGISEIITFDIHAPEEEYVIPFTNITTDRVFGNPLMAKYGESPSNLVLCSPDAGGMKRVELVNKFFDNKLDVVTIIKKRTEANKVDSMQLIGDVKGKRVVIIDDILDTGGTLCKAAEYLLDEGAISVGACITHGLLSRDATTKIAESKLDFLMVSGSITGTNEKLTEINRMQQDLNAEIQTQLHLINLNGKVANIIHRLNTSQSLK
jgi:ribose-phosphate pyrophosphokinase